LQKEKLEKSKRSNEKRLSNSKNIESTVKGFEDVEIIKTKQTIEIVFEPKKRREGREGRSKELLEAESKLVRLEKERDLLERKL
jgi:sporulation-control protein spo0M